MIRNFSSLVFRFSGTIIQFLTGILIARFSSNEITAYYFLILSTTWIAVYAISLGFPNHIFIVTSESEENSNHFDLLKKYIWAYIRLALPIILFILTWIYFFNLNIQSSLFIALTSLLLSINRFCCEVMKGSGNEILGILFDRTIFPTMVMLNIILLNVYDSFSISSINSSFVISSSLSLLLSYFISANILNKAGSTINRLFIDKKHISGQYIIELGEVLINRLPIIIFRCSKIGFTM